MTFTTWKIEKSPLEYLSALNFMEHYVDDIISNNAPNLVWLLEHFDVFTKGSSASDLDLLYNPYDIPVVPTNRGGKITYHGIGQRIIYPIINLNNNRDIHKYVENLQRWIVLTLNSFDIDAFTKKDFIGVWVSHNNQDKKISAIGIRVKKWVAFHGVSININPSLEKFNNIIPCGISDFGITSTSMLGKDISYLQLDQALITSFNRVFCNEF